MKSSSDIIIIGGGVIGCSIAWRLAQQGAKVTVIERGEPGLEASWAAAGKLDPHSEPLYGLRAPLLSLCEESLSLYPAFVTELEDQMGIHVGYQARGSLLVATDYHEATLLSALVERQFQAGKVAEELSQKELREFEPELSESVEVGVYFPNDCFVNNRELMTALVSAAMKSKVNFLKNTPVIGLKFTRSKVSEVILPTGCLQADIVINAAGSWASLIDPTNRIPIPIRPIRGQIVCLQLPQQTLGHLTQSAKCYLVPWPDGRVIAGSTMENVGYNKEVTAKGVQQILTAALEIVPSLASASIREVWAGLRPGSQDALPLLGTTQFPNYIIASGHFRHGILLAPITAKLITDLILTGKTQLSLEPYRVDRFKSS